MTASDLTERVEGIVHEDTQVHERGLDLTVADVYEARKPGRVDFGGGELEPTDIDAVDTELHNEDDDYEWWNLDGGTYLLEYNESLTEGDPLRVQTRDELRHRGAFHPGVYTATLDPMPLTVADGGIRLKENARVSTVFEE
ncbi:dCTP deaminase [Halobacterium zhouii]|uniref:dCTP deaminase n=1 Tax=Halobacterium zhouii TaxID=2902624 RepID=UPI001E57FE90|nr:dCTP deaminase [Halobacterium zhouii]